jgi:hypothetical protein
MNEIAIHNSPGNAENADIAASAGNGKRRPVLRSFSEGGAPNAERFPISTDQRDAI